ncbi:hypothetical protein [Evansella tamaricis]|uniref:Uncharacterized protein n=1 Tax=Evansella tamaricis TaxID=2069301 RepID=A0ABS6JMJ7_9BACI|nr:hypothetical protein [Evansella tamaricis]MBU9714898.1 hypothetical protein [Evansella tamaricis]
MFLVNLVEYLLSSKKALVYTTFKMEDYYKATDKLKAAAIKYRIVCDSNRPPNSISSGSGSDIYKIYVKKKEKEKAQLVIHKK